MNRRTGLIYIGLPILYLAFLFLLLILQFSGGSLFTETLGPMNLSGVFDLDAEEGEEALSSLSLEVQGFKLSFDHNRPLILSRPQGEDLRLELLGYEKTSQGFEIHFERGVSIETSRMAESEQLVLKPQIPAELSAYRAVSLPFEVNASYNLTETYPGLDINFRGKRYILSLPPRSLVEMEEGRLVVSTDSLSQDIRYTPYAAGNEDIHELWFQNAISPVSLADFNQGLDRFVEAAYRGWRSQRFNSANGTWSHRNGGAAQFRESILMALLSEAWARNDYARAFTEMRTAADQHRDALTFRSATFLGNLRPITAGMEATMRPEILQISNLINQRNPDVLAIPGFIQTAVNHGNTQLVQSLLDYLRTVNPQVLTASQRAGLLVNLMLYPQPIPELQGLAETYLPFVETDLLPMVIRVDEGLFFQQEAGVAESRETVLVGFLFQRLGEEAGDERFVNLGRQLVLSILALADDQGFVPERIEFTAGAISAFNRFLGPEELYPILNRNPHYPRETSLYAHFGAGSFVYTIAEISDIQVSGEYTRLDIKSTANRTHYMIVRGVSAVDPLSGMELFGITYRDAADFEIYSRGRYYNPASRTLMIKYFDEREQARIMIYR